jgi:hypothetical protein
MQLDCIAIGIAEVDGFAHLVIVRLNLEARRFELQLRLTDPGSDFAHQGTSPQRIELSCLAPSSKTTVTL